MNRPIYWLAALALLLAGPAQSLHADDEPKLKLAIREAAEAARRAGFKKVLVVVRVDIASTPVTDAAVRDVENLAVNSLSTEKNLESAGAEPARELARKNKARRALQPVEARAFKEAAAAEGVLCLDYREGKAGASIRLTLADGDKAHFNEQVQLNDRITGVADKPADKKPADKEKPKGQQPGGGKGPNQGPADAPALPFGAGVGGGGGGRFLLAPPTDGSTGYAVRTDGSKGTGGRTASQAQTAAAEAKSNAKTAAAGGGTAKGASAAEITTAASKDSPKAAGDLSQKVVDFAARSIGQQVGNGECWTLANEALKAAGAQPADGYTFGTPLSLNEIRPGDILQFTNARFEEPGYYVTMGAPNHTAVVYSISGERVFILQQNFNGKRTVGTFDIRFSTMTGGDVKAYRAVPRN